VALVSNPKIILAEEVEENLDYKVSLREKMDTSGDETIDDTEKAAFRKQYLKRFDRNNDGMLDKNERRHARRGFDRAEDRWDRREDIRDRREDRRKADGSHARWPGCQRDENWPGCPRRWLGVLFGGVCKRLCFHIERRFLNDR